MVEHPRREWEVVGSNSQLRHTKDVKIGTSGYLAWCFVSSINFTTKTAKPIFFIGNINPAFEKKT